MAPTRRPAPRRAALHPRGCGLPEQVEIVLAACRRRAVGVAALLGFKNEAAALVRIDPPEIARPVAIVLKHAALEDVVVMGVVGAASIRGGDPDEGAEAVYETLCVRELGPAGFPPLADEVVDRGGVRHRCL